MRHTRGRTVDITTLEELDHRLRAGARTLSGWRVRSVDLSERGAEPCRNPQFHPHILEPEDRFDALWTTPKAAPAAVLTPPGLVILFIRAISLFSPMRACVVAFSINSVRLVSIFGGQILGF